MKILYVSSIVPDDYFTYLYKNTKNKPGNSNQKYHQLFCKGLSANLGEKVTVLSQPPVTSFSKWSEEDDYIEYKYSPILQIIGIKQIIVFVSFFIHTLSWIIRNIHERKIIFCSATRLYNTYPVIILAKLFRIKLGLIVCDIPSKTFYQKQDKITFKLKLAVNMNESLFSKFDFYVPLTSYITPLVNKGGKPSIVVEGFSDVKMSDTKNDLDNKYDKKVIIYAGGLFKKYGIEMLIDAVLKLNRKDVELWLFGKGDVNPDKYTDVSETIKFKGVKLNSEVLKEELKATLLVNPRFSNEEYTQYSFTSKVLEYMSTGTFTILTHLKGIPDEYFKYCGEIKDETIEGLADTLNLYLNLPKEELHKRGQQAKEYVLGYKNNILQTKKILDFIKTL